MASDFIDEETQEDSNDFDIIIIGGGITGLTAAYVLLKKKIGLDVLVLEANSQLSIINLPFKIQIKNLDILFDKNLF